VAGLVWRQTGAAGRNREFPFALLAAAVSAAFPEERLEAEARPVLVALRRWLFQRGARGGRGSIASKHALGPGTRGRHSKGLLSQLSAATSKGQIADASKTPISRKLWTGQARALSATLCRGPGSLVLKKIRLAYWGPGPGRAGHSAAAFRQDGRTPGGKEGRPAQLQNKKGWGTSGPPVAGHNRQRGQQGAGFWSAAWECGGRCVSLRSKRARGGAPETGSCLRPALREGVKWWEQAGLSRGVVPPTLSMGQFALPYDRGGTCSGQGRRVDEGICWRFSRQHKKIFYRLVLGSLTSWVRGRLRLADKKNLASGGPIPLGRRSLRLMIWGCSRHRSALGIKLGKTPPDVVAQGFWE